MQHGGGPYLRRHRRESRLRLRISHVATAGFAPDDPAIDTVTRGLRDNRSEELAATRSRRTAWSPPRFTGVRVAAAT
jgi:hypothetical protein